ncbi:kinesin-like protein KIF6 [Rhinophrynus dorsalis]
MVKQTIQIFARVKPSRRQAGMIARLRKEIQALKDELALVTGEQRTEELTEEEILRLEEQVRSFLEDQDPESMLEIGADIRKIQHCFGFLKKLLNDKKTQDSRVSSTDSSAQRPGSASLGPEETKKLRDLLQQRDNEINILVNMLKKEKKKTQDAIFEMNSTGMNPRAGTIGGSILATSLGGHNSPLSPGVQDASDSSSQQQRLSSLHWKSGEEMSLGRQEAFEIFKRDYADRVTIEDNKGLLKQRFAEAKSLGEEVNKVRNRINELKGDVEQRRIQRAALGISSASDEMNKYDPVEEELRSQMEGEKKRYKTLFNRLKALKTEIEHLQLLLEKAKVKLHKDFEVWWSEEATNLQTKQNLQMSNTSASASASLQQLLQTRSTSSVNSMLGSNSSGINDSTSRQRAPQNADTPIPLTGDSQTDADILAFVRARQNLMQRKGSGRQ